MRTHFLLLIVSVLLLGCNKETKSEKKDKIFATKKEAVNPENVFTNRQISSIEYQIEAFKIGYEKSANPELKKYLKDNLPKLEKLLAEFKSAAADQKIELQPKSEDFQKELYKLAMADTKGFDNVFVLYYKEFLNKTIQEITSHKVTDETFNALKNNYGNILYEQKLYFDIL